MSNRRLLACIGAALSLVYSATAAAADAAPVAEATEVELLPGASREIHLGLSASRDTAAMGWALTPYSVLTAGADLALVKWKLDPLTLRFGFFGMIELESDRPYEKGSGDFIPRENSAFWRAHGGYSVAASFEDFARRTFGERGAFELTLSLRHESEHFTGSIDGNEPKYGDRPHIGNFLLGDAAVRLPAGAFDVELRVLGKLWLGERAYSVGPGGEAILRWRLSPWVHPFSSLYGEYVFGRNVRWDDDRDVRVPDNYRVRNLTGLAFPGRVGDIMIFNALEVGHGKGLHVYEEEFRWGGGIRLAIH